MTCINIFVGQCGNQLGNTFLNHIAESAIAASSNVGFQWDISHRFFRIETSSKKELGCYSPCPVPRCICIDMESRIIADLVEENAKKNINISPQQCIIREEGSANNWAFGYLCQGPTRIEAMRDSIQKELESCDGIADFHIVHSIAGGTGSGVSCLISELIREAAPSSFLLHTVVWPFDSGDTATQWYNATLSLSHLVDTADSLFLLFNEDVARKIEANRSDTTHAVANFTKINEYMTHLMSSIFLPQEMWYTDDKDLNNISKDSKWSKRMNSSEISTPSAIQKLSADISDISGDYSLPKQNMIIDEDRLASPFCMHRKTQISDIIEFLSMDPSRKLFTGEYVSFSSPKNSASSSSLVGRNNFGVCALESRSYTYPWLSVCGELAHIASVWEVKQAIISLRGSRASKEGLWALTKKWKEASHFPSNGYSFLDSKNNLVPLWNVNLHTHELPFKGMDSCGAIFGTSHIIAASIAATLQKVEMLLHSKAFLHHFERHGVEECVIKDAVIRSWDIVQNYAKSTNILGSEGDTSSLLIP